LIYKNTLHGHLSGRRTMTENERLFESIALKGQCPDCNAVALESNGPYVQCKSCRAMFIAQEFYVRRVKKAGIDPNLVYPGKDADFVFPEE
jgi:hypothetical protein